MTLIKLYKEKFKAFLHKFSCLCYFCELVDMWKILRFIIFFLQQCWIDEGTWLAWNLWNSNPIFLCSSTLINSILFLICWQIFFLECHVKFIGGHSITLLSKFFLSQLNFKYFLCISFIATRALQVYNKHAPSQPMFLSIILHSTYVW